jgi:hypothetical protein
MAEDEVVWPVGTTDRDPDIGSRPMVFNPKAFLVAILSDADELDARGAGEAGRPSRGSWRRWSTGPRRVPVSLPRT